MITATIGKRQRGPGKRQAQKKVTRQFRAPRPARGVIPGLLMQTRTEKKVISTIYGGLAMNGTGSVTAVNLIQVGSSMFNRVGRKIEMRSVRLVFDMNTLQVTRSTTDTDIGRIMLVYDRQTNGANPAIADILQDTDQTGANTSNPKSGLNMDNRERFVTILDRKITNPQATNTAGVLTNVYPSNMLKDVKGDEFRKLRGLTTHYKADSNPAVIGDISTGALFLVTFSSQAAGSELFSVTVDIRLKYVDV